MSFDLNGLGSVLGVLTAQSQGPAFFTPQQTPGRIQSVYESPEYGVPVQFSFVDCQAHVILPFITTTRQNPPLYKLPGLQLFSGSTHRDKYPVVSSGRRGIRGYTRGHRLAAGTLGFTVLSESPWAEAMRAYAQWKDVGSNLIYAHPDELPPFDMMLMFTTEALDTSILYVRSMTILDSALNVNVNDIQLQTTYSFQAAEITEMVHAPVPRRILLGGGNEPEFVDSSTTELRPANSGLVPAEPVYVPPTPTEPSTP